MGNLLRSSRTGIMLGLYGLVNLLLVIGLCSAAQSVLQQLRERSLAAKAADYDQLERELFALTAEREHLQAQIRAGEDRRVPTLDELKRLSTAYELRLIRVERQGPSREGTESAPVYYSTTFRGSALAIVRFLRALEEQYLCAADRVELWPADQSGSEIAVQLSVGIWEP